MTIWLRSTSAVNSWETGIYNRSYTKHADFGTYTDMAISAINFSLKATQEWSKDAVIYFGIPSYYVWSLPQVNLTLMSGTAFISC